MNLLITLVSVVIVNLQFYRLGAISIQLPSIEYFESLLKDDEDVKNYRCSLEKERKIVWIQIYACTVLAFMGVVNEILL